MSPVPLAKSVVKLLRDRSVMPHGLGGWNEDRQAWSIPGWTMEGTYFWLKPEGSFYVYGRSDRGGEPFWDFKSEDLDYGQKYWLGQALDAFVRSGFEVSNWFEVCPRFDLVELPENRVSLSRHSDSMVLPFSLLGPMSDSDLDLAYFSHFVDVPLDDFVGILRSGSRKVRKGLSGQKFNWSM